jgi:hypothetical protein
LSVTFGRWVVFSRYSGFLYQWNWPPWHSWNIIENGVNHHDHNPFPCCSFLERVQHWYILVTNIYLRFVLAFYSFKLLKSKRHYKWTNFCNLLSTRLSNLIQKKIQLYTWRLVDFVMTCISITAYQLKNEVRFFRIEIIPGSHILR